jgi:hypothetical protein
MLLWQRSPRMIGLKVDVEKIGALNVLHRVSETFSLKLIFQRSLKVYFDD